jgi:hypothetical protein
MQVYDHKILDGGVGKKGMALPHRRLHKKILPLKKQ